MSNPIDLIKNGDFVEVIDKEFDKKEYYLVLTDWYGKILFVKNGNQTEHTTWFKEHKIISKIFRYKDRWYSLEDGLKGDFPDYMADIIYDREKDSIKEVTVKEVEEKFGCRVKIVSEPVEKIVKGGMYKGFKIPNFPDKKDLEFMINEVKDSNTATCRLGGKINCRGINCRYCIFSMDRADKGNLRLEFLEKLYEQEYGE